MALLCVRDITVHSPCMRSLGIPASTRGQLLLVYVSKSEVDALVEGIYKVKKVFGI